MSKAIKENRYAELRNRQQKEFDALPLGFAVSDKQFDEVMRGWGLDPEKDIDKVTRIPYGGFIQKKDLDLFHDTVERNSAEMKAAIEADETGEGFIYEMFLYELDNHEYCYTGETEDTLDALGYTAEEVVADKRLNRGLTMACNTIMGRYR